MARTPSECPDATLRLLLCEGAGARFAHDALARFGTAEAVVRASADELAMVGTLGLMRGALVRAAMQAVDVQLERERMERAGVSFVMLGDAEYPPLLALVPFPPLGLWVRGRLTAAREDAVAIVGARRATAYGISQAGRFAAAIAAEGIVVVSGGARGIDAEAHRAALRVGGATIAVLGCGLGEAYPPEHTELYESIVEGGGLLASEFPTFYPPLAENFPRRNRIISGLASAVLVVEAARASGALITARYAIDDHGREVCAVPGPVDSARSTGCNEAIRDGWAHAVLEPADAISVVREAGVRAGTPASCAPDLAAAGVPTELRSAVVRAMELLARRPRITAANLASSLGLDEGATAAARTFALILLERVRADRAGRAVPADQVQPMA